MRRIAAALAVLLSLLFAAPAAAERLTVMTFNVWYGGVQVESDRIVDAIEAADPDGMPGNRFDWVGIYRARPNFNVYGYYGFKYTGARPAGHMTMTTADLGRLAPGRYVAGLFMDDGYSLLARTSFLVRR